MFGGLGGVRGRSATVVTRHNQPLALLPLEHERSAVHPSVSPLECDHRRVPQHLNVRVLSCRVESFSGDILELPFKCCRNLVPSMHSFRRLGIRTRSKKGGVFAKRQSKLLPIVSCHRVKKRINCLSDFRLRSGWDGHRPLPCVSFADDSD